MFVSVDTLIGYWLLGKLFESGLLTVLCFGILFFGISLIVCNSYVKRNHLTARDAPFYIACAAGFLGCLAGHFVNMYN